MWAMWIEQDIFNFYKGQTLAGEEEGQNAGVQERGAEPRTPSPEARAAARGAPLRRGGCVPRFAQTGPCCLTTVGAAFSDAGVFTAEQTTLRGLGSPAHAPIPAAFLKPSPGRQIALPAKTSRKAVGP